MALGMVTIVMLSPLLWMLMQSFKYPLDTIAYPPKFVFPPTLENYVNVLGRPGLARSFFDSCTIAVLSVGLAMLVGVPAAYSFARFQYRFKPDLAFFVLSTRMMPYVVAIIPFMKAFRSLGISDTHLGIIAVHVLLHLALVVWTMRAFFMNIPVEVEEAALLDGCTWASAIARITLPLAAPGLAATAVLSFIFSWNDLLFGYALTSNVVRTIPVRFATEFIGYLEVDWGAVSAAGVLAVAPVVVFLLLVEKHLVRGFSLGLLDGR